MTRKHFIKLAQLINDNVRMANVRNNPMWVIEREGFMHELCKFLHEQNENFDERKFREATGEILGE
tara:strand:+ start:329 stop:526 length:198 start_codon:yes stop_codon:yes gene_type:complete